MLAAIDVPFPYMNRRQLLKASPALASAFGLRGQAPPAGRLRAGLVAYSFRTKLANHGMTYEDLISYAADLGLDGLDTTVYWFTDTSDQYLASLRRAAYKNAISLYSVAARVNLCQATPELRSAEVENARKWVDVAQRIGAAHVRVFGGAIPKAATEEQAIPWAAEVLKRAAEYAGSKGVFLGVEDDGGLSATAEPAVAIVKQADSPWAGINLDIGNFPKDGYAQTALCIPYAVNVHFKAKMSNASGAKEATDVDRVLGMLVKGGYRGYVSLEYEEDDPDAGVPRVAADLLRGVRKYSA
jgi:sugar phosphate isomerase/epimerase